MQFVIAIRIPWTERYQDTFKAADGREIAVHNLGYIVERSENRALNRRYAGQGLKDIVAHKVPLFEFHVDGLRFTSAYQTVTGQLILDHVHAYGVPTDATLYCRAIDSDGEEYLQRLEPLSNYQLPERFIAIRSEQLENL